jgi:hypothetical protein
MTRDLYTEEADREDWRQTFARMAFFSLVLLAVTAATRVLGGFRHDAWIRELMEGSILRSIQNWAWMFLAVAIPPYCWLTVSMRRGSTRICADGLLLLLAMTLGVLASILLLRGGMRQLASSGYGFARSIPPILDLAGGLAVPMVSGFTLIMLPCISPRKLRGAAKILGTCCVLTVAVLELTIWAAAALTARKGPTVHPVSRPAIHGRTLA